MGLLDGYFDPEQFQASGGLLGRLLSLPQMQGLYQPGAGFDPQVSADNGQAAAAQMSMPLLRPTLPANGPAANPQTLDYGRTQNIPIGDYQIPQFARADVSQAEQQATDLGDRLSAGFPSRVQTPVGNPIAALANGIAGVSSGRRTDLAGLAQHILQPRVDPSGNPQQDLNSQYQALRPILGDHDAMLAIVHPEVGRTLIAQALAGQTKSGNTGDADPSGNGQAGRGNEASSIVDGQPPGLSKVGYLEIPTNPNQAFGELQSIQQRNEKDAVSGKDYASGVRDGNITYKPDGSLDVTNGTVVTFSYSDGHAKTVTVTNDDIAHIDAKTGEVVIQKSF
jgi:hypothetical protein